MNKMRLETIHAMIIKVLRCFSNNVNEKGVRYLEMSLCNLLLITSLLIKYQEHASYRTIWEGFNF